MTRRSSLLVMLLAVTAAAAFAAPALLKQVPLKWKPTSDLKLGFVQMATTPIQFEPFKDVRENPDAIGENREDDKPKPVTTSDDVGAFVGTHVRDLFKKAGLNTVDADGGVVLKGEVTTFFVRETNTYQGDVQIHVTVVGRDGTTLYSGTAPGAVSRFGRSYKLENYYEVLSDAVVNATSTMLQDPAFQKALAQR